MDRNKRRSLLFWAGLSLLILGNVYLLVQIRPLLHALFIFLKMIFFPFFIAIIISYILNPVVGLLTSRMVPRFAAVLLIYATFIVSSIVVIMNMLPLLGMQFRELTEHLPEWMTRLETWFYRMTDGDRALPLGLQDSLEGTLDKLENMLSDAIEGFLVGIRSMINQLFIWFIIPFIAFYMLKDFKAIERSVVLFLPKQSRQKWLTLFRDIDEALGNYVRGQLLVCLVVGILAYIGYLLIGLPYAFLLASIVSLMNIIPYLGPFIGAAPAVLVGLTQSWQMAVAALVVNMIVQVLEGNVVSPQIVGRTLQLHPLVIILALLVGSQWGGILGLIFAVPFVAVAKVVIDHVVRLYVR